jgi:hypothetical protein
MHKPLPLLLIESANDIISLNGQNIEFEEMFNEREKERI